MLHFLGDSGHAVHVAHAIGTPKHGPATTFLDPPLLLLSLQPEMPLKLDLLTDNVTEEPQNRPVQRPPMRRAVPYASALNGMERTVTRTRTPKSTTVEAIIDMYGERPLPPVPRIPSSIYASSKRETLVSLASSPVLPESPGAIAFPPSPATPSPISPLQMRAIVEKDSKSAKHLSQLFRKEPRGRVSPSEASKLRQNLVQRSKSPINPKAKAKEPKPVPFTEWKPPIYKEPSVSSNSSPRSPPQYSASFDSPRLSTSTWRTAEGRAASYFALINPTNPLSRSKSRRMSSPHDSPPFPFAVTKERTKQRILPLPIRTHSLPESPPRSHFSPSSPSVSDFEDSSGMASSLRSRARKAFLPSKTTKLPGLKQWMNSSQSDILCDSPMSTTISNVLPSAQRKDSMAQSLSDVYDTLESMSTRSRKGIKRPALLRGDHSYPFMKKPTRELRNQVLATPENQKHNMKDQELSKTQPYVYRVPRMRLSKPQMPPISTSAHTKGPDTTYKIEMPPPQTPQRPESLQLFDESDQLETSLLKAPYVPNDMPASYLARKITTKVRHFSRPLSGSGVQRQSHRVSKVEKQGVHRHSLPTSAHSRQNSDETTLSDIESQALRSSPLVTDTEKSAGSKWMTSMPVRGLAIRETGPGLTLESERGRHRERRGGRRERTGSTGTSMSAERRREELKKRIKIMGDPNAVGIPF